MNVWAVYRRYVLMQALILVSGWFSLNYAWGLEIKSWPVALGYLASMSLGYPILAAYGVKQQRKGDTP